MCCVLIPAVVLIRRGLLDCGAALGPELHRRGRSELRGGSGGLGGTSTPNTKNLLEGSDLNFPLEREFTYCLIAINWLLVEDLNGGNN